MDYDAIYRKAMEEHKEIRAILTRLHAALRCGEETPVSSFGDLCEMVAELSTHLRAHFAIEEDGGFMTPVLEERPNAVDTVDRLKGEHEEILDQCDEIQRILQSSSASSDQVDGICERLRSLIEQLHEHERLEDELIQSVFVDDMGTKD